MMSFCDFHFVKKNQRDRKHKVNPNDCKKKTRKKEEDNFFLSPPFLPSHRRFFLLSLPHSIFISTMRGKKIFSSIFFSFLDILNTPSTVYFRFLFAFCFCTLACSADIYCCCCCAYNR